MQSYEKCSTTAGRKRKGIRGPAEVLVDGVGNAASRSQMRYAVVVRDPLGIDAVNACKRRLNGVSSAETLAFRRFSQAKRRF